MPTMSAGWENEELKKWRSSGGAVIGMIDVQHVAKASTEGGVMMYRAQELVCNKTSCRTPTSY